MASGEVGLPDLIQVEKILTAGQDGFSPRSGLRRGWLAGSRFASGDSAGAVAVSLLSVSHSSWCGLGVWWSADAGRSAATGADGSVAHGSEGSAAKPGGSRPWDVVLVRLGGELCELCGDGRCCGHCAGGGGGVRVPGEVGDGGAGFAG